MEDIKFERFVTLVVWSVLLLLVVLMANIFLTLEQKQAQCKPDCFAYIEELK